MVLGVVFNLVHRCTEIHSKHSYTTSAHFCAQMWIKERKKKTASSWRKCWYSSHTQGQNFTEHLTQGQRIPSLRTTNSIHHIVNKHNLDGTKFYITGINEEHCNCRHARSRVYNKINFFNVQINEGID